MEMKFKIHRGPNGEVKGYGPNVEEYQPGVQDGDTLEYSNDLPGLNIDEIAAKKIAEIDMDTSNAIQMGFDYTINDVTYHVSYDAFDQVNFIDSLNVANLVKAGVTGLPQSTPWNMYKNWTPETGGELVQLTFDAESFIQFYTTGALTHKAACMTAGIARKNAVKAALARKATVEEINAI